MRDLAAQAVWIASKAAEVFDYGKWDCVLLAAGAVLALTGEDRLAGVAAWTDEKSAKRAMASRGGLLKAVSGKLEEVPISLAMRGDIGAIEVGQVPMLVVIEGMSLVGAGLNGLERVHRRHLVMAWSAGQ